MNDLMRNKKVVSKRVLQTSQNLNNKKVNKIDVEDELERNCSQNQCKPQYTPYNNSHECNEHHHNNHECNEHHHNNHDCGCNVDCCDCNDDCTDNCFQNPCGEECGCPLKPAKFTTAQTTMYPIETNRVYDTMMFRVFTDGDASDGSSLVFDYELGDLCGPLPCATQTNVTIEKVCINYGSITINTGITSLEELSVNALPDNDTNCNSIFEYDVCGQLNKCCNQKCMGQNVAFKEKGLNVVVSDLEIELTGKFGCSEFTAIATPEIICESTSENCVVFSFNTLSADLVVPANGKSFKLRETFQTQLTVDCIGKGIITQSIVNNQPYYQLSIPNGIDLVCCLQNVVSVLMEEQIVVLGGPTIIEPRLVDTFGSVCDFSQFSENCKTSCNPCNNNNCGC